MSNHNGGKPADRGASNDYLDGCGQIERLACACGIMGWEVPEQKEGNKKLILKYVDSGIQFNHIQNNEKL